MPHDLDEDVLSLGPRRRLPRWLVIALGTLAVVIAAALVLTRGDTARHAAAPAPTGSAPDLSLLAGQADIAVAADRLYRLAGGALYRLDVTDPATPSSDGVVAVGGLDNTLANVSYHLVLDAPRDRVWVVGYGAAPALVVEFDTRTLTEVGRLRWPGVVSAAAALHGQLYLAATNALVDVAPDGRTARTVPELHGQYFSVVADPTRSRLLLLGTDRGIRVETFVPSGQRAFRGPAAPFGKGSLLVVGGAIWAGGYGDRGAVLARLDPTTLLPVAFSELTPQLGPGAILAAAGSRVLWVRSGSGGDGLWCLAASTGDQLQFWQYDGAVASRRGAAYVAVRSGPLDLRLGSCPG